MFVILEYGFMQYAFIAGVVTAITSAILGNFIVASRQSVVSDMFAHVALVGVGLGILWEVSPTALALVVTLLASLVMWKVNQQSHSAPEAYSMLLLTGGLALALLLAHANKNNPVSFESYLFGSILTIRPLELFWFLVLNACVLSMLFIFWRPFLSFVFDPAYFRVKSATPWHEILFMLLIGAVVGLSLKVIGGLLLGALFVIPVLVVRPFCTSFQQSVFLSVIINTTSTIIGIVVSFYFDVPTSSAIVLSLVACFLIAQFTQKYITS